MKKYTGKENYIHAKEKEAVRIKYKITFLDTSDELKQILQAYYKSVIGNPAYPEEQLPNLYEAIENLRILLDWAWIEHVETQKILPMGSVNENVNRNMPTFLDYSINSYYPQLQASIWPKERRERFNGNVLLLSQEEIYWEGTFFIELFSRKNIRGWKELLNSWLGFALDDQNNIIDVGISKAYECLEDYEYLQKLIEIAWLSIKQDEDLLSHEYLPWFNMNSYPVFTTMEGGINPYNSLYGFFHRQSLYQQKKELNKWFKFVFDNDKIWEGIPADLAYFFSEVGLLIESCWLIKELGPNYPNLWNNINSYYTSERAPDPSVKHKYNLSSEYIDKPENYLKIFFKENSMEYSFHCLFKCFCAALGHDEPYPFDQSETRQFQKDLIKLIEAGYLIQKMKFPNRIDKI